MSDQRLTGRTALVTGASRGLGAAVAERLARLGAEVVITYLDNRSAAEDVARRVKDFGSRVELVQADLRDASSTSDLCDFITERRIDVLVNNGGAVSQPCGWRDITIDAASSDFAMHAIAPILLMSRAGAEMARRGEGHIVNVTSSYGLRGEADVIAYSSAKAALIAATRAMARALRPSGVLVNAVAPGNFDTAMTRGGGEDFISAVVSRTPAHRLGYPDEVADAVEFLLRTPFACGLIMRLDGGFHL